jgi:hypothetical protein
MRLHEGKSHREMMGPEDGAGKKEVRLRRGGIRIQQHPTSGDPSGCKRRHGGLRGRPLPISRHDDPRTDVIDNRN